MKKISEINLYKKKIFLRLDLNVPIYKGKITSYSRIDATIPTIQYALKKKSTIIIASHLGRPIEGKFDKKFSLFPVFEYLKKKIKNVNISFKNDYLTSTNKNFTDITILENVRFNVGEKKNSDHLSKKYASLCDVFVMDAFATAHRIESSTVGISKFVKEKCAGPLLLSEIKSLKSALFNPKKPMTVIISGAKVSTKFHVIKSLIKIADFILVGGGIANTFLSINNNIGKSLYEYNFKNEAKKLIKTNKIVIPIDSRVKTKINNIENIKNKLISEIQNNDEIMDIGDKTIQKYKKIIKKSKTILWNGPLGVFENKKFRKGTEEISKSIANSNAFTIAGGGDTLSVINLFKIKEKISYISTGGGSFLEFIEKKQLPAIKNL